MIENSVKKIIDGQTSSVLMQWWHSLNSWEWVEQIPNEEKPVDYKKGYRGEVMRYIESKVGGMKPILKFINKWDDETSEKHWLVSLHNPTRIRGEEAEKIYRELFLNKNF